MTSAPALPLRADSRLLLSHAGAPSLPSPVALQLLDIPFVLPLKQLPERVDGQLPRWAYEVTYSLVGADRTRYEVRVTGDPTLGLPFGQDADVLLALFKILEQEPGQHDLAAGVFRNPSYQMICRALGKTPTGRRVREIRDALMRLSGVRIYSRVLVDKLVRAAKVLAADGTAPEVPTAGTVRRDVTHEMRWLLEYRAQERFERGIRRVRATIDGPGSVAVEDELRGDAIEELGQSQMWIRHLALNPFWVAQAVSGWAGWIDVERHARLKSPTARRLYQICAATAARQVAAPWLFAEDALSAACLLTTSATKKPTKVRQQLESAADELREAGVLAGAEWLGTKRGPKTFEVHPAPLLQFADLLRGIGLTDPPDFRVQYAVLRHFGVTPAKARALLGEYPGQVGEVLLRACHLEATDPKAIEKSWAGWIVHHVQAGTSFRGEVEFQRWRSTALAAIDPTGRPAQVGGPTTRRLTGETAQTRPQPAALLPEPPMPRIPAPYALPEADPDAARWWESALAVVLPAVGPLDRYGLEVAVPVAWTEPVDPTADAELAVWVHPDDVVTANTVARTVTRLEAALSTAAGRAVRLSVERHSRRAAVD
ncbi:hypothetical protein J421_6075 (plasmid) [Gemmatirosa kalamazoonensis]|uniref:Uncharacterized protein n=1 Tax=Gemmatirosa kalamazoonensis TaxID=861299 RepID=W0RTG6_9BACT|nr:hypothetical protein [Gemmatirosa kalamazoonensis]AHG93610.1 hypothetical protein J421_6075 [Gemmatirosa kalamazoonensis]